MRHVTNSRNQSLDEVELVCIVGLGYVGLTFATHLARKGLRVQGVEIDQQVLDIVRSGRSPFMENGLDDALTMALTSGLLTLHKTVPSSKERRTFIVAVGTPVSTDRNGSKAADLRAVQDSCRQIVDAANPGDLVILRSSVPVGTTKELFEQLGLRSKNICLGFAPERTLEGRALQELLELPQIVSGVDEDSLRNTTRFFERSGHEVVRISTTDTAELAKLVNNVERDAQFAFANEIAMLCEEMGMNFSELYRACREGYSRSNLHQPGPVAGPCLSKDGFILTSSTKLGRNSFANHARLVNSRLGSTFLKRAISELASLTKDDVLVLSGIAFKGRPTTSDFRDSYAETILENLEKMTAARIELHDFMAQPKSKFLSKPVSQALDLEDDRIACVVFQNNHPENGNLDLAKVASNRSRQLLILDLWNQFEPYFGLPGLRILTFGEGAALK